MADPHPIVSYSKRAKFADVRDDLKLAIEGKNNSLRSVIGGGGDRLHHRGDRLYNCQLMIRIFDRRLW